MQTGKQIRVAQPSGGECLALKHLRGGALGGDLPAARPGGRSHFDQITGRLDDGRLMLHHNHGVAFPL